MAVMDQPLVNWDQAPETEAYAVGHVVARVAHWEQGIGKDFRLRCERFYRQYRGFRQFRDEWTRAGRNDRDGMLYDAQKHWGAHLHIPLSFRTIETVVPRAIANMPKMLISPRDEQWRKNVETVRLLIDAQQEQINIDLSLQGVMRSGMLYGLGVSKTYWKTEYSSRRRMQPIAVQKQGDPGHVLGPPEMSKCFDDPMYEDLDVFDFMWDPMGFDVSTCGWIVHRIWLSTKDCLDRLEQKRWNTESAALLTEDKIRALGGQGQKHDEIWRDRMTTSGFSSYNFNVAGEQPHELLEFHDGNNVYAVLDRQVLVQHAENTCSQKPFQIYRPTPLQKQMVGIGALEPLEHLQRELDTLRSQRRDAATIRLNPGFIFDDAAIDEEDLVFGPAAAIRVTNSRPQDAIQQIKMDDIPGSGYQEEQVIRSDIEAVSGMQDALDNSPGGVSGTATEAQLVQAALGRRIELLSRRFETENIKPAAQAFLELDQSMISENRPAIKVPEPGQGQEEANESGRWREFPVGPGELEGDFEIVVEGGSMAAKNIPQDRSDAQTIWNLLAHDWYINPTKARLRAMELIGIKHPQSWLRDPTPAVPMATLRMLLQAGVDPKILMTAVIRAREISAPQEGPAASQITEMVGSEGTA